ncbi:hypothetical protein GDO81_027596 [Engystomops pustulosus]|uniref:Uncharacterized protein n=1 Tax=Engystomops pustulosus TaxID=76066 RepID=A0AAV6YM59_ENGPU|nr:hypothetical protein GDO81_027596 [Engystomops pustulosus]
MCARGPRLIHVTPGRSIPQDAEHQTAPAAQRPPDAPGKRSLLQSQPKLQSPHRMYIYHRRERSDALQDSTQGRGGIICRICSNGLLFPWCQVFWEDGIMSGYRHPKSSALDCLLSSFQMTNETVNIWTHFLPTW